MKRLALLLGSSLIALLLVACGESSEKKSDTQMQQDTTQQAPAAPAAAPAEPASAPAGQNQ